MSRRVPVCGVFTFLCCFALSTWRAKADPLYSVIDLGSLGMGAAMPTAINNSGAVVGFVTNPSGDQNPVSFSGTVNPFSGIGQANAINDAGIAVGTTYSGISPSVTEWSNGNTTKLGIFGYGTGVNNANQVVGGMIAANGQLHAFLWSNGELLDLGQLAGATWSSAYGINSSGEVVGTSSNGGAASAFVYNGSSVTKISSNLGGANSYGMAINSNGAVVGSAQTGSGYLHAFEFNGQGVTNLGTLGGSQSYAYGINDAGTVVGYSLLAGNQTTHAFVYLGGILLDLNALLPSSSGWTIDAAYGINNSGDIVGVGALNGQLYAVELTPSGSMGVNGLATNALDDPLTVPEPLPFDLTALALTVGWLFQRKQSAQAS